MKLLNKQLLLSHNVFYSSHDVSPFVHIFDIISLFAAELEKPKIGISGKELRMEKHQIVKY